MIKRLALFAMVLCGTTLSGFSEIQLKSIDSTTVEITFTYKDDSASEMGAIGSFNNWTVPGTPMSKNGAGLWTVSIRALPTDELMYKFYSKGTWITDDLAPDTKDDGYGGKNGLIVVADILSGVTPASPAAKPAVAAGTAGPVKVPGSKLNFGMTTVLGTRTTFSTQGMVDKTIKGLETDTTGFYGRMGWNFNGTLLPGISVYFNGTAFDKYYAVWAQDARGIVSPDLTTGVTGLAAGLLSNPVNFLGGANPVLKSLKAGFETPLVVLETGEGEAAPTKHGPILWETLTNHNANNGYLRVDLGKELRKFGPLTLEANLTPNKMYDNFGVFGWLTIGAEGSKLDLTYAAKSAESASIAKVLDKLSAQDFVVGFKTSLAGIDLAAQALTSISSDAAADWSQLSAAEIRLIWNGPGDVLDVTSAYRVTGTKAAMLFGNNNDGTGNQGTQRIVLNLYSKALPDLKLGIDSNAVLTTADLPNNAIELYAKPYLEWQLEKLVGKTTTLNAYAKANFNAKTGYTYAGKGSASPFILGEAGAKLWFADPIPGVFSGVDSFLGLNNWDKDKVLTSLVMSWKLPGNSEIDVGAGLRTVRETASAALKSANNLLGFCIGGSWKLPIPDLKNPVFFGGFTYNMDALGEGGLAMSDYLASGGQAQSDGKAQLRAFLKWEF